MSTTVVIGGVNYTVPATGESGWGQNVSDTLIALAANISGGGFFSIVNVTTSPVTATSGKTYLVDTTAARQINLPAPANNAYLLIRDKSGQSDTHNITIHRAAGEKIDAAAADKVLSSIYGSWLFISDGTDWYSLIQADSFHDRGDPQAYDFYLSTFTTDGNPHDLDLSSVIPVGTKAVILYITIAGTTAGKNIQFFKKGYTGNYVAAAAQVTVAGQNNRYCLIAPCDVNRKISYVADNEVFSNIFGNVGGWFK